MAPVTSRVPDGEQDGFVIEVGSCPGFLSPRVPVDRIVLVLEEIRRRFVGEAIGHGRKILRFRGKAISAVADADLRAMYQ
jgi:hypothetical protein